MYRLILAFIALAFIPACSSGMSSAPVAGYGPGNGATTQAGGTTASTTSTSGRAAPLDNENFGKRVAAYSPDRAPAGSFDKAPKGAFEDRDYSKTTLNPVSALKMINAYRVSKGLKRLTLNDKLTKAAKAHSLDLAHNDRISHHGSDGSDPWERVQRTGYRASLAAENVGTGQVTLAEVFKGWKDSPGHNANMLLDDATQMGIALVKDPKTEFKTFWTLVLGSPIS